jgi:hypothetical protein
LPGALALSSDASSDRVILKVLSTLVRELRALLKRSRDHLV